MSKYISIVVTTIFEAAFLDGYLENIHSNGWKESTVFFIISDRKTPTSVYEAAKKACKNGFDVRCPDLEEQVLFLKKLDLPEDFIPWNTDNRRNLGFFEDFRKLETLLKEIFSLKRIRQSIS